MLEDRFIRIVFGIDGSSTYSSPRILIGRSAWMCTPMAPSRGYV
jgi:predicted RNA-binding protein YlxR (DUF448 family)